MKAKKKCQSCGMPLDKDLEKAGTHADGSKNEVYCHYCYEERTFSQPDTIVSDMKKLYIEKLKQKRIPAFLANLIANNLPKLERWNNK